MAAIIKRELGSYFTSPIGYIYLAVFYIFAGIFFYGNNLSANIADIEYTFQSLFTIVLFVIPLLTMKLLSDEKRQKTDQALLTSPISLGSIVLGKYFAALIMFTLGILITVVYAFVLSMFATVDWMVVLANLLGLLFMGGALISIGLFISSLTESQIVSAIASFALVLLLYLMDTFLSIIPFEWLKNALSAISFYSHYTNFTYGIINLIDIVFFVSMAAVFLFLTIRVIDKRRWS